MSIVLPENISFNDWMASLLVDFNTKQVVPKDYDEINWREICDNVATSPIFTSRAAPLTSGFSSWQEWAKTAVNTF